MLMSLRYGKIFIPTENYIMDEFSVGSRSWPEATINEIHNGQDSNKFKTWL